MTDCLTMVPEAAARFYSEVRGLTVTQEFAVLPDDSIICVTSADGTQTTQTLRGDDEAIFRNLYPGYFG